MGLPRPFQLGVPGLLDVNIGGGAKKTSAGGGGSVIGGVSL